MTRHLVLVLGDQLDAQSSAFDGFAPEHDQVWMAEVDEESTHVWSSKPRSALFLAAMRHFRDSLLAQGYRVHYRPLDVPDNRGTLAAELALALATLRPQALVLAEPGDWRVSRALQEVAASHDLPLEIRPDRHFYCTLPEFARHARGRRQLRLEYFYRELRQRHAVLLTADGEPVGGQWNYDASNRESFGKKGPPGPPAPPAFQPDSTTTQVLQLVGERYASHPGSLSRFAWPVTRTQALTALDRFIDERLPQFGRWQDAMWPEEPWLWHSQLSAALNLKLLNPREVVEAAAAAYHAGTAPLASVEGFIRQILGWREYVRGIYWTWMPDYLQRNALGAQAALPAFYWNGETSMACLEDAIGQTLAHGYAHHIQRLMITGLYALLLGVTPGEVHAWYLAVYVDAVEWVELPNTLGMSQAADGGLMASKPYIASGRYIERMSGGSLCARCRYRPGERLGQRACPFTTLYWDFLIRHEPRLAANPRMGMQVRNLQRLDATERLQIRARAELLREHGAD